MRTSGLHADLRAEVDPQLPRRPARLGEVLDRDDAPDAHVDARELVPAEIAHGRSVPKRSERYGVFSAPLAATESAFGTAVERSANSVMSSPVCGGGSGPDTSRTRFP